MFAAIFKGDKYCWYTCCSVWCWWQGTVRLMIYTCFSVKQVWAIPISHVGEWYMRLSFKIYSNKPKVSLTREVTQLIISSSESRVRKTWQVSNKFGLPSSTINFHLVTTLLHLCFPCFPDDSCDEKGRESSTVLSTEQLQRAFQVFEDGNGRISVQSFWSNQNP